LAHVLRRVECASPIEFAKADHRATVPEPTGSHFNFWQPVSAATLGISIIVQLRSDQSRLEMLI
jgi:hypothetical protein